MHTDATIQHAAKLLEDGAVVAFPTETVYGLGADATNPRAVEKIFEIKQRPADHPLIVHIRGAEDLSRWSSNVSQTAYELAQHFWPGPLTLILSGSLAHACITGGQSSIGLRAPRHPVAQSLIDALGKGIAAPSANRFGKISPTRAEHVFDELGTSVDLILEGGDCEVGLESTILSLVSDRPCILRPGAVSKTEIEEFLKAPVDAITRPEGIRASGLLDSHYAPNIPLRLMSFEALSEFKPQERQRIAVMRHSQTQLYWPSMEMSMPLNAVDYGKKLYAALRQLDRGPFDLLIAETPPLGESWTAILDRLTRASHDSMS